MGNDNRGPTGRFCRKGQKFRGKKKFSPKNIKKKPPDIKRTPGRVAKPPGNPPTQPVKKIPRVKMPPGSFAAALSAWDVLRRHHNCPMHVFFSRWLSGKIPPPPDPCDRWDCSEEDAFLALKAEGFEKSI